MIETRLLLKENTGYLVSTPYHLILKRCRTVTTFSFQSPVFIFNYFSILKLLFFNVVYFVNQCLRPRFSTMSLRIIRISCKSLLSLTTKGKKLSTTIIISDVISLKKLIFSFLIGTLQFYIPITSVFNFKFLPL